MRSRFGYFPAASGGSGNMILSAKWEIGWRRRPSYREVLDVAKITPAKSDGDGIRAHSEYRPWKYGAGAIQLYGMQRPLDMPHYRPRGAAVGWGAPTTGQTRGAA